MRRALLALLVVVAVACVLIVWTAIRLPDVPPMRASLAVTLGQVPDGATRHALVTGPGGFAADIAETTVLRNLRAGHYDITADPTTTTRGPLAAFPSTASLDLTTDANASTSFAFAPSTPVPVPRGEAGDFAFEEGPPPTRWNPCRAVQWSAEGPLPDGESERLTAAFDQASAATGISFRPAPVGSLGEVTVDLREVPGTRVEGEGTMRFYPGDGRGGTVFAGRITATLGTETSSALRQALYLHEIGHVLGLAHVPQNDEVMHEEVDEQDALGYSRGDTAGLIQLGGTQGCLESPTPPQDIRASSTKGPTRLTWFQPASDAPISTVTLRAANASSGRPLFTDIALVSAQDPNATGQREASATIPPTLCRTSTEFTVVTMNSHGETRAPVTIPGCPAGS